MLGDVNSYRATKKSEGKQSIYSFIHDKVETGATSSPRVRAHVLFGLSYFVRTSEDFATFAIPFEDGWYGETNTLCMQFCLRNSLYSADRNGGPLSLITCAGRPTLRIPLAVCLCSDGLQLLLSIHHNEEVVGLISGKACMYTQPRNCMPWPWDQWCDIVLKHCLQACAVSLMSLSM